MHGVLAFLPLPIVALASLIPRKKKRRVEKFGAGRWRTKVWLLLCTSALATLGATFRVSTGYAPRPVSNPAWYHSRACYYCFNFVTDLIVSTTYLFLRFDRRFIVPNGAKGPGDYRRGQPARPPSVASSGGEKGNDTDPEKLARLRTDSNSSKDKGKGKNLDIGSDDKSPAVVDRGTQTIYGQGSDWYPWPFRTSWATPRNRGPMPSLANRPSESDSVDVEASYVDYSFAVATPANANVSSTEGGSSQWGGETNSTYLQELGPAHVRVARRQFHPRQLQHDRPHTLGQAYTADEALHSVRPVEHVPVWPFTSETHASGRDPVTGGPSRSHSVTASYPATGHRAPSRGRINRSLSCKEAEIRNPAGGWI